MRREPRRPSFAVAMALLVVGLGVAVFSPASFAANAFIFGAFAAAAVVVYLLGGRRPRRRLG